MKKQELLNLVGKGIVTIGDSQIEVKMRNSLNSDYLSITQKAINAFTTDHEFSGGWVEYITDEDTSQLEDAFLKAHEKMVKQAEICSRTPLVLTTIENSELCEATTGKKYVIQKPAKDHFEIYSIYNGEIEYAINAPVLIDGKLHLPVWSWWLDKGCYLEINN